MNTLKATELYSLNGLIVQDVNSLSVKLASKVLSEKAEFEYSPK